MCSLAASKRFLACVFAVAAIVGACQDTDSGPTSTNPTEDDQAASSTTTVAPEPTEGPSDGQSGEPEVETRDEIGPRAMDLIRDVSAVVDAIDASGTDTLIRLRVVNGRDQALVIGDEGGEEPLVVLRDNRANTYPAAASDPIEVPGQTIAHLDVRVTGPLDSDADDIMVEVLTGRGQLSTDPIPVPPTGAVQWQTESRPMAFGDLVGKDENNRTVQVFGVADRGTHLDVSIEAVDAWSGFSTLDDVDGTVVLSDGTELELINDARIEIQRFHPMGGVLRFLGGIPPGSNRLDLTTLGIPVEIPIDPAAPARATNVLPDDIATEVAAEHPNGMTVSLSELEFVESGVTVAATVSTAAESVVLNDAESSQLVDDLGNVYPMSTAAADPELSIPADTSADLSLVFAGRIDPQASSVRLVLNSERGEDSADTDTPGLELGPVEVTAPGEAPTSSIEPPLAGLPTLGDQDDVVVDLAPLPTSTITIGPQVVSAIQGTESIAAQDEQDADTATSSQDSLDELEAERGADGIVVTLEEAVLFEFDSAELLPSADDTIQSVIEGLTGYPTAPIEVAGHTDSVGSSEYNLSLSEERASAVAERLVAAGIPESRVTVAGYGETRPVAPNTTPDGDDDPEGRALNRRVEIIVTS